MRMRLDDPSLHSSFLPLAIPLQNKYYYYYYIYNRYKYIIIAPRRI